MTDEVQSWYPYSGTEALSISALQLIVATNPSSLRF
jgi:hypothetical protein